MIKKIKKIVFLTGTRADFGKLKSLILKIQNDKNFKSLIFVTGMHMLKKYGETHYEVNKSKIHNIQKFINQNYLDRMDTIMSKTISGFSDYVREVQPDMIIVHGDRVEALAAAIVGALNNVKVAHIEGGEVSGTVDEVMRHAITKMANIHFVSNKQAYKRLVQLGEHKNKIYDIGSPDIDIMKSKILPKFNIMSKRYKIPFQDYGILLFHPVTSEIDNLNKQSKILVDAILKSNRNLIIIYPNNDHGSDQILNEYEKFEKIKRYRVIPSMRFEYFLTALKNAQFIIGNSSAGIREAPHFGVPTINVGSRQKNRAKCKTIININYNLSNILKLLANVEKIKKTKTNLFGSGNSANKFYKILKNRNTWKGNTQKQFKDYK